MDPELFVDAYDSKTGALHTVPKEWLDHPVLGQNLRKTPPKAGSVDSQPTSDKPSQNK